jgi:hypothetical protein
VSLILIKTGSINIETEKHKMILNLVFYLN